MNLNRTTILIVLLSCIQCITTAFQSNLPQQFQHYHRLHSSPKQSQSQSQLKQLHMLPISAAPIGSIGVLCFVVLIHEAGHYLAARTLGMKVSEFSIGVGPKLLGFQALGNDFSLRAFPLGGYVRFPENYNTTLLQLEMDQRDLEKETLQKENYINNNKNNMNNGRDVNGNPDFVAGLLNILSFGTYNKSVEKLLKEQQQANPIKPLIPWYKKQVFSKSTSTKKPLPKSPQKPFQIDYYSDPDLLQNRPWPQRAAVIGGGVVFNFILAFAIYFGEITTTGLARPTFGNGAVVASIPKAASAGILRQGDLITQVNGQALSSTERVTAAVAQQSIADFITKIRDTTDDETLTLAIVRANQKLDVTVQPTKTSDTSPKSIGVMLKPNFLSVTRIQTNNIPEAATLAAKSVQEITSATAQGLGGFLGKLAQGKGASAGQGISGPVGLIRTGSEIVSTNDLATIVTFAAAISVNLAVVNSLPLPALDGGQMIFILFEAVTGRKVDQRLQESITSAAVLLLLLLTVGTTFSDVESILR
jgi:membrane-associated protease RseP (regulator of RpoE activity)